MTVLCGDDAAFEPYSAVSSKIWYDSGVCERHGKVYLLDIEFRQAAVDRMNGRTVWGRPIQVICPALLDSRFEHGIPARGQWPAAESDAEPENGASHSLGERLSHWKCLSPTWMLWVLKFSHT